MTKLYSALKCPLLPVGDVCVVVPDAAPQATGRVLRSAAHAEPTRRGQLVAVGPDAENAPPAGAWVAWRPFCGTTVEIGDGTWLLLREDDIVCELEEER